MGHTKTEVKEAAFQMLPVKDLHESVNNPRKRFNEASLNELAESIKSMNGIVTPLLVRPNASGYEIGAGHRRYRAAKMIGLEEVPCIIRPMNDEQFLELLVIENDQREDVHPLEEAAGYFALSRRPGYDVDKIADRIGRSKKYVYDRMKLLSLIKKAQELFLADKFSAGHAILLARLSPSDQAKAIDPRNRALLLSESYQYMYAENSSEDIVKPVSVREFQCWIDDNVRFERKEVDPILFPETTEALKEAEEESEKVVPITELFHVQPSARADEKTIGPMSWKRADGKSGSKTCEHSVTGVFVVGPGRGQAIKVCIAKEKCKTHWGQWQKEREKRQKESVTGGSAKAKEKELAENKKREEEQKKVEERRQQWKKAKPAIYKALGEAVKKLPADSAGVLAGIIKEKVFDFDVPKKELISVGKNAEDFVRFAAHAILCAEASSDWRAYEEFPAIAKKVGLDVLKVVNEANGIKPEQSSKNKKQK